MFYDYIGKYCLQLLQSLKTNPETPGFQKMLCAAIGTRAI